MIRYMLIGLGLIVGGLFCFMGLLALLILAGNGIKWLFGEYKLVCWTATGLAVLLFIAHGIGERFYEDVWRKPSDSAPQLPQPCREAAQQTGDAPRV